MPHVAIFSAAVDEDLPAGVGLSPLQDVLGEWGGFQLVLVKGEVPDDQGLTRGAIELDGWVGGARGLEKVKVRDRVNNNHCVRFIHTYWYLIYLFTFILSKNTKCAQKLIYREFSAVISYAVSGLGKPFIINNTTDLFNFINQKIESSLH